MKKVIFSIMLILVLLLLGTCTLRLIGGSDKTRDETSNWPAYYAITAKHYMTLPDETIIIKAIHTETAIMGERIHIEFRLPALKSPKEWLDQIQSTSPTKESWRKNDYLIDCGRDCDLWRVEYLANKDIYSAEAGWD